MAETLSISKVESLPEALQKLMINGEELPEKYIYKGSDSGFLDASLPSIDDLPIIDIGLLMKSASSTSNDEELEKLRLALTSWGCFQAINHGIETTFLEKLREVTRQFFALPQEEKQKYSRQKGRLEGYSNEKITELQTLEWSDRMSLMLGPEDKRQLKFWPDNPKTFREILHEYTIKLQGINEVLLRAMARSLKLDDNSFLNMYGEIGLMLARFNYYPPCPRPDQIIGFRPHTDGAVFTYVLRDNEVEGLQILKDHKWFKVPILPHALLINLGDLAEIMSNGMFKSPEHRVVTNSKRDRISLAVFCAPSSDKEIGPIDELINERNPRLYKKIKDYGSIYFQHYQQGRRPIKALMI